MLLSCCSLPPPPSYHRTAMDGPSPARQLPAGLHMTSSCGLPKHLCSFTCCLSPFAGDSCRHQITRFFCPLFKTLFWYDEYRKCWHAAGMLRPLLIMLRGTMSLISYCPQLSVCIYPSSLAVDSQLSPAWIVLSSLLQHLAQRALAPRYTAMKIIINENKWVEKLPAVTQQGSGWCKIRNFGTAGWKTWALVMFF